MRTKPEPTSQGRTPKQDLAQALIAFLFTLKMLVETLFETLHDPLGTLTPHERTMLITKIRIALKAGEFIEHLVYQMTGTMPVSDPDLGGEKGRAGHNPRRSRQESKRFFFEKMNQKTFGPERGWAWA